MGSARPRWCAGKLFEAGHIPDVEGHLSDFTVGGIVYLSRNGLHQVEYSRLVGDLLPLVSADAVRRLQSRYEDPHHTVNDDLLVSNPCHIRGGSVVKRASKTVIATPQELKIIIDNIPERFHLMIMLAAWCAMRSGELTELRVKDLDLKRGHVAGAAPSGRLRSFPGITRA